MDEVIDRLLKNKTKMIANCVFFVNYQLYSFMRKQKYLWNLLFFCMTAIMVIGFVSCGGDDEENENKENIENKENNNSSSSEFPYAANSYRSYTKCPDENHPHAIDLGLPSGTLWACCDCGNQGYWYAAGPSGYNDNTWTDSLADGPYHYDVLYNISGTRYDHAKKMWGGKWQIPTIQQFWELADYCFIELTLNGGWVYRCTGQNGASIILKKKHDYSGNGLYWTGSRCLPDASGKEKKDLYSSYYTFNETTYGLAYHLEPSEESQPSSKNHHSQSVLWRFNVKDDDGHYDFNYVRAVVGGASYGSWNVPKDIKMVDLGLAVKWADRNIGASSPEDFGNYYAWRETETKSEYTKYNSIFYNEKARDYTFSGDQRNNDVASLKLGGYWRMPNRYDIEEMLKKCKITETTKNGINGYNIKGPNGNSIFLPSAGMIDGTKHINGIYYWTGTMTDIRFYYNNSTAFRLQGTAFLLHNKECIYDDIALGMPIRPVSE